MIRFGSICSGIEAASVAWLPLGWRCQFASEIEAFPRAVLHHHYPDTPLHGDFTDIQPGDYDAIDLLVGGTPCQSFSIAGLRRGMADARGNLALEYLRLVDRLRPQWVVWENVPGVLSSNGGRDFGAFLGGLAELGYGFAYRVLDAQYFGLAQRRKRVFVVGHLGDWRRAAAVLFEPASLRGNPAPRREAREGIARPLAGCAPGGSGYRNDADTADNLIADTLSVGANQTTGFVGECVAHALRSRAVAFGGNNSGGPIDVATAVNAHGGPHGRLDFESETFIAHTLSASRGEACAHAADLETYVAHSLSAPRGGSVTEDGTGRGTPLVATAYSIMPQNSGKDYKGRRVDVVQPLMAGGPTGGNQGGDYLVQASAVRRLTPRECERLQGFPDDYTAIPWRGGIASDGPRYRALGNSMAVPVMRWIGARIAAIHHASLRRAA